MGAPASPAFRDRAQGVVDLRRNTMANWVIQTAETCLKPFSDAFLRELLKQAVIHADETVVHMSRGRSC